METNFSASLLQPECVEERDALSPSTQATSIHCSQLITQPGQRLCECGKGAALLGLPIGSATARWCPLCPNKAWNAIKRCDCRRKKARFGLPYQELKDARWCADCPSKPVEAVNLEELAAAARVAAADAARAATSSKIDESSKPCVCGKSLATLALPIQAKLARWCPDCPDRPRNAIPVAGRCSCGRRKATLGMPDDGPEGAKWCPHCPDKPDGYEVVVQLLPIQDPKEFPGPRAGRYTQPPPAPVEPGPCVCGRTTATLALPIQLWLAKWCPDCPERPRNAVDVAFRYDSLLCAAIQAYMCFNYALVRQVRVWEKKGQSGTARARHKMVHLLPQ